MTWQLRCAPAGGSHPQPREACAEVASHSALLGPVTRPCTLAGALVRRGAPQATVVGRVGSRRVIREFQPACDSAAWSDLHVLLTGG